MSFEQRPFQHARTLNALESVANAPDQLIWQYWSGSDGGPPAPCGSSQAASEAASNTPSRRRFIDD